MLTEVNVKNKIASLLANFSLDADDSYRTVSFHHEDEKAFIRDLAIRSQIPDAVTEMEDVMQQYFELKKIQEEHNAQLVLHCVRVRVCVCVCVWCVWCVCVCMCVCVRYSLLFTF